MTPGSAALASGRLSGRSTLNDPHFVRTFFAASRLHFIGSWKRLFQSLVPSLLSTKPRFPASAYAAASASSSPSYVLHCDLDCFFASIAERDNPALKGKPVAVCHARATASSSSPSTSSSPSSSSPSSPPSQAYSTSSISSCNYVARSFGLHAEMSIGRARRLCPELCIVPYEFSSYAAASESIYRIFFTLTHRVQPVSLDEAYLELPASMAVQDVQELARELRRRVESETGVQLSIGISHSLLLARLATKAAKPNNLFYLPSSPPTSLTYMSALSVAEVPGIGWVAQRRLQSELSVRTCGELQRVSRERLQAMFGQKQGSTVFDSCRGVDHRQLVPVSSSASASAISAPQRTLCVNINYGVRFTALPQVGLFLSDLSDELLSRLSSTPQSLVARALTLKLMVRHPDAPIEPPHKFLGHGDCNTHSKSSRLDAGGVGGGELERDRDRLRAVVAELWEKMRAEWEIKVEDLRGVSLQFAKLQLRAGGAAGAAALSAFSAYGFKPVVASSEQRGEEEKAAEARVDGEDADWEAQKEQAMAQALDEAEEWKEDGMEEDMEDDDRAQNEQERQSASPSTAEPEQPAAATGAPTESNAETPAAASAPLSVSLASLPPQLQAQLSSLLSLPGSVPISISAALSTGSAQSSSASSLLASATVSVSIDQLVQLIASVSQQQQLQHSIASSASSLTTQTLAHAASPSTLAQQASAAVAQPPPPASKATAPTAAPATSAPQASPAAASTESISSVVEGVAAAKERHFLASLPPFSAVDRTVVAALPIDVRQELAAAYKKKRSLMQDGSSPAQQPQPMPPPAAPAPAPSRASTVASHTARLPSSRSSSPSAAVDLPSFSQVDPSVLAALPPSIRDELQREYARRERSAAPTLRQPAVGAAATRGGKAGRGRGRRRGGGAAGGGQADRTGGLKPLHSVSIAEHFAALEHDRKQEEEQRQRSRTKGEEQRLRAGIGESRENAVVLSGKEAVATRGEREEKQAGTRPTRRQLDMDAGQEAARVSAEEMEQKYATEAETAAEPERAVRGGGRQQWREREEKEAERSRREAMRPANLEEIRFLQHAATARAAAAPLTASRTAAVASPPPAPLADSSPQSELVASINAAKSSFLPLSAVQPQLSLFLRTARASHPHAHPSPLSSLPCCQHTVAAPCSCSPLCLCCRSSLLTAMQGLLQAQMAMGNLELVAGLLRCLSSLLQHRDKAGGEAERLEGETAADSECCCFDCSVAVLLRKVSEAVSERYGGVVKAMALEWSSRAAAPAERHWES